MSASQNNLSLIVNQQDTSGVNIINRSYTATYSGTGAVLINGILTTTGATAISFPPNLTNAMQVLIKNTHATANIRIDWTPTLATGSIIAGRLTPGSVLALWQAVSGSSGAITALTGTADVANATYELFLGG